MNIRACHPYNFKRFLTYEKNTGKIDGRARQLMSDAISLLTQGVSRVMHNVSVEIQSEDIGVGSFNEALGRYDGCIGLIQSNASDLMLQLTPYPAAIENVTQGLIMFESSLVFCAAYNRTEVGDSVQVLKSFDSFSTTLWLVCLLTVVLLSTLLKAEGTLVGRWKRRWLKSSLYQVVTHCFRFGRINAIGSTRRVAFLVASLFSLVVVHYFSTNIKTELVVIKDPLVFKSYQDIIDRGAMPVFMNGMSYDSLFNSEHSAAFRKKLWEYAARTFGRDKLYVNMNPITFLLVAILLISQKAVLVSDEAFMPIVPNSGCPLTSRDPDRLTQVIKVMSDPPLFEQFLNSLSLDETERKFALTFARDNKIGFVPLSEVLLHISQDKQEKKFNQGLVLNSHNQNKDTIISVLRRLIETGFVNEKLKFVDTIDLLRGDPLPDQILGPPSANGRKIVERCKSKSIVKPAVLLHGLGIANFTDFFYFIAIIYSLLFALLGCEILSERLSVSVNHRMRQETRKVRAVPARVLLQKQVPFTITQHAKSFRSTRQLIRT